MLPQATTPVGRELSFTTTLAPATLAVRSGSAIRSSSRVSLPSWVRTAASEPSRALRLRKSALLMPLPVICQYRSVPSGTLVVWIMKWRLEPSFSDDGPLTP